MNLLYISKHGYIKDENGNVFSVGMMGPDYFEKYLPFFDRVTVIGYVRNATEGNRKKTVGNPIADTEKIHFELVPCGSGRFSTSLTSKDIKAKIEEKIETADAVVCKSASGASLAAHFARKYHKPYMVEVVGCPWDAMVNHSLLGKILAPYEFLTLRRVVRHAPFVTYVTEKFLQGRYPTKGKSAAVSDVQLEEVNDDILERRLKKPFPATIKMGTAGALHVAYKGQKYVMDALAQLKEEGNTSFEYHLAGGGSDTFLREYAKQKEIEDQVVFEGSIPHENMFTWFDQLDLYIQPSTVEGLPRALVEAMSRGLPAFASKVGGMPELLNVTATFEKKDVDAIANLLRNFSEETAAKASTKNFNKAKEFQKELLEEKRYAFYADFAESAKGERK